MTADQAFKLTQEAQAKKIVGPAFKEALSAVKAEAKKGNDVAQYKNPALDGSLAQELFQKRFTDKGYFVEVNKGEAGIVFVIYCNPETVKAKLAEAAAKAPATTEAQPQPAAAPTA